MKKIFSCLFLGALILSSCEDFLDKTPLDQITDQNYWKTTSDLELYVNQYYTQFPGFTIGSQNAGIFSIDNNSDNMIPAAFNTTLGGVSTLPSSGGGWSWTNIRSVNVFLDNYKNVASPLEDYNTYVGEAMFFKAYFYFNLLKTFGDVPWYAKPLQTNSEGLFDPRTPRHVVADSILSLLDNAITRLKVSDDVIPFRINKEVALLFKSRVALFEGTWEKYHAGTAFGAAENKANVFLQQAVDAASELINMGTVGIYSTGNPAKDYVNLFNAADYAGISEVMLWKKFDRNLAMGHSVYLTTYNGHGTGLSKELVESYLATDGLPISLSGVYNGDANYITETVNRDPRLIQTIFMPGDEVTVRDGNVVRSFEKPDLAESSFFINTTGYQIEKGHRPVKYTDADFNDSDNASIIFRYAEVLLNYAEAKAELGTVTQEDLDMSVNKLRDRVSMPHMNLTDISSWNDPDWDFPTLTPAINEIRRERRVELASEGFRFDDLRRWKAHHLVVGVRPLGAKFSPSDYPELEVGKDIFINGDGYIDPYQKSLPSGWGFDPNRDYLSPIPTNELTLNSNLAQNPGWQL